MQKKINLSYFKMFILTRFEVFMALNMQIVVFWIVMSCNLVVHIQGTVLTCSPVSFVKTAFTMVSSRRIRVVFIE
jgi:hypothetical protein